MSSAVGAQWREMSGGRPVGSTWFLSVFKMCFWTCMGVYSCRDVDVTSYDCRHERRRDACHVTIELVRRGAVFFLLF